MTGLLPGVVVGGRYTLVRLLSEQGDARRGPCVTTAWTGRSRSSCCRRQPPRGWGLRRRPAGRGRRQSPVGARPGYRRGRRLGLFRRGEPRGARFAHRVGGCLRHGRGRSPAPDWRKPRWARRRAPPRPHHLGLTPDNVLHARRLGEGGRPGPRAALAGQDHIGGRRALRRDAKGLVALSHAGLTGRWPYAGDVGLQPAPRVVGGVPARPNSRWVSRTISTRCAT